MTRTTEFHPSNPTTATLAQINVVTSSASDSPKLSMVVHSHLNVTTLAAGLTWLGQSPRRSPTVLGTAFARCTRFRLRTCPGFASARLVPHARPGTSNGPESTCEVEHPVSPRPPRTDAWCRLNMIRSEGTCEVEHLVSRPRAQQACRSSTLRVHLGRPAAPSAC